MRRRWTWIALSLLALFVVSMVVTTILSVANGSFQQEPAGFLAQLVGYSAFTVVGALIVAHRPGNAIGCCRLAGGRSPGWPEPRRRPS
jgi:hypothetical protein